MSIRLYESGNPEKFRSLVNRNMPMQTFARQSVKIISLHELTIVLVNLQLSLVWMMIKSSVLEDLRLSFFDCRLTSPVTLQWFAFFSSFPSFSFLPLKAWLAMALFTKSTLGSRTFLVGIPLTIRLWRDCSNLAKKIDPFACSYQNPIPERVIRRIQDDGPGERCEGLVNILF